MAVIRNEHGVEHLIPDKDLDDVLKRNPDWVVVEPVVEPKKKGKARGDKHRAEG